MSEDNNQANANKVFIGGLFRLTTEPMVAKFFSKVGKVRDVNLVLDRETGESRGFGFVEFESDESAKKAIEELNDSVLDKRRIKVSRLRQGQGASSSPASAGSSSETSASSSTESEVAE